jgi:hypothetical protein
MFFIPLLLGLLAAGRFGIPGLLFLLSATAAFLAREPVMTAWRGWRRETPTGRAGRAAIGCVAVSGAFGLPLVALFGRYWLLPVAAAAGSTVVWHAERAMRGKGRSVIAELFAIAASMLAAPAAVYAATGQWTPGWELWALCTGYFLSSVFYVKMRVTSAHMSGKPAARRARVQCTAYHMGLAAALPFIPVPLGYAPVILRALHRVLRPTSELNLKKIGWTEVGYSLWFVMVVCARYAQFARSMTVWGS